MDSNNWTVVFGDKSWTVEAGLEKLDCQNCFCVLEIEWSKVHTLNDHYLELDISFVKISCKITDCCCSSTMSQTFLVKCHCKALSGVRFFCLRKEHIL